jgi:hypothetical protein
MEEGGRVEGEREGRKEKGMGEWNKEREVWGK